MKPILATFAKEDDKPIISCIFVHLSIVIAYSAITETPISIKTISMSHDSPDLP